MRVCLWFSCLVLLAGCQTDTAHKGSKGTYFDLKGYISAEAKRLNTLQPTVQKRVAINEETEQKIVRITDFNRELASFTDADINKQSWQGEFNRHQQANTQDYTTTNEKIPIKLLRVTYHNSRVKAIQVISYTHNLLYHSIDTLSYYPDSLYEIKKSQKIRFMKDKRYRVVGRINKPVKSK